MRIGLAGPVRVAELLPWLDIGDRDPASLPRGLGATPVTLLARALLRRGHELVIATLEHIDGEMVLEGPQLRLCLVPHRDRHYGRDGQLAERRLLEATLRREAPDLVHAHWTYEYALAALRSGLPTLITVHDWAPTILRLMPDPYRAVRLGMFAATLARARHLTAVSPYIAGRLRHVGRAADVVPNALEDGAFDGGTRKLRTDAPLLLSINDGFRPWKNMRNLLRAHHQLRTTAVPGARLVLVGQDHEPQGLAQQWADGAGLSTGVEFVGSLPYPEVQALLAGADLLVHPSLEESFGMVVLEAMAQGLPVVAGASSGAVPWVMGYGRGGVLVDVRDPAAIAGAVRGLLEDPERWSQLSRSAHEHAWDTFRMEHAVDGYLRAYARLRTREV